MILSAESALLGGSISGPTTVELQGRQITDLRPWAVGDPPPQAGLMLPGLINAHTHLELSFAHEKVPGGAGFTPWLDQLLALGRPDGVPALETAVDDLVRAGTVAVSDICNGPSTAESLLSRGIGGIVQREIFGLAAHRQPALMERARQAARVYEGELSLVERSSPHALYSMHPELLRATIQAPGAGRPGSLHIAEAPSHLEFLRTGEGPLAEQFDRFGIGWRGWRAPGVGPIQTLEHYGLLLPDLLLVHGTLLEPAEQSAIQRAGLSLVLCPRSNVHITGRLPPVMELLSSGLKLALGTDSLASNADVDVLNEVRALKEAFPTVPLGRWLEMATAGGAEAIADPTLGRLEVGRSPGLLLVHPERPWEARAWLVRAGRKDV